MTINDTAEPCGKTWLLFLFLFYFSIFMGLIFDLCFLIFLFNYKLSASCVDLFLRFSETPLSCAVNSVLQKRTLPELLMTSSLVSVALFVLHTAVIHEILFAVTLGILFYSFISLLYCCNYCGFLDV